MIEVIAEISSNYNGDLGRALALIEAAVEAGADTVKFQMFTPESLWRANDARREAVRPYALPLDWLLRLKEAADAAGVEFLCTPFSPSAVAWLQSHVRRYKIASGDLTYLPLLEAVSKTKLPVLLSVGYATIAEVEAALARLEQNSVTLLYCTGGYPTPLSDVYPAFVLAFSLPRGLSAHWLEWWFDLTAVPMGFTVFERHFDLDDGLGSEAGHSLKASEFRDFVKALHATERAWRTIPPAGHSESDAYARINARRDPSDWLRPIK